MRREAVIASAAGVRLNEPLPPIHAAKPRLVPQSAKSGFITISLLAFIGRIFVALGEIDVAFQWFERAYQERDPDLILLDVNPSYDAVRHDPRFQSLLRKVGFPR